MENNSKLIQTWQFINDPFTENKQKQKLTAELNVSKKSFTFSSMQYDISEFNHENDDKLRLYLNVAITKCRKIFYFQLQMKLGFANKTIY